MSEVARMAAARPDLTPAPADADLARLLRHPRVQRFPGRDLTLLIQKHFLSAVECAGLIARIDAQRRPSTIADPNGDDYFRTSETCDLSNADPFVAAIDAQIAEWVGIDAAYGEYLQGQRYDLGQEFKPHTDYFEPNGADYAKFCSVAGNRTWTVMIYLDQPKAGGATRFTKVGKTIQPEPGKLLAWNNRLPDGSPNPASMHHGMKVRAGVKHVITKWFRERPWG
jgi:prolyl 4-hydroxylase